MTEVRALQACVAVAGLVPVGVGLAGALFGLAIVDDGAIDPSADSHFRYLSGLLLALGIGFWSGIPAIEDRGRRFRLLTFMVAVGGLGRLYGLLVGCTPDKPMLFGLFMELVVTPALCLWQGRVARNRRRAA